MSQLEATTKAYRNTAKSRRVDLDRLDSVLLRLDAYRVREQLDSPVFGVTSCDRQVGVSTIAANLAARAAKMNFGRVLLIDCHTDHPRQGQNFRVASRVGLLELVSGTAEAADVILPTSIDRLYLLPAGSSTGEFSPEAAQAILKSVRSEFEWTILDLPPVENTGRSLLFNQFADAVLLVVGGDKTRARDAKAALDILAENNLAVVGTVLNRATRSLPRWLDRWF